MKRKILTIFCLAALIAVTLSYAPSAPQICHTETPTYSQPTTAAAESTEIPAEIIPSQAPAEKPAVKPEIRLTEPVEIVPLATLTPAQPETPKAAPFTMENSLFIGDSRTTGLADYSGMEGVDYFADVGMNVYTVGKRVLPVEGFGEISLADLLEAKKYDKIYIMLGINEVGYAFEKTVDVYGRLLDSIIRAQPEAEIFVQANLHVTAAHSARAKYVKNEAIDGLNALLCQLASDKNCHYIDVNPFFDDENGALMADKSGDGVHLRAKYYIEWARWIAEVSEEALG
ncbi:MAG: hypothetical protein E7432_07715 [Ruminococcaceae bacterium]|nr:hypothetical protein [Oscillospiraceae bacterium]